ncbi:MAG: histidine phosphatase family protein [Caulobacterales bacterium]|nr:histidine phosphatase family protein [Caulobacterales bacterium]
MEQPVIGSGVAPSDGAIILARHGRPALDRKVTCDWRGFADWWRAYDAGGLADGQSAPSDLVEAAAGADVIYSSVLQRSRETAREAAPDREVRADPIFVEAPLPAPPLPGLRMRPDHWNVIARVAWWLGFSGGLESRVAAERRADDAAERLIAHAERGEVVLVCAHGWFNRMMRPSLQARGWRCVRDGRDSYWSFRRYERPSS